MRGDEKMENKIPEMSPEIPEKDLPTLVDNTGNFPTVEKETPTSLTGAPGYDKMAIQYPKEGDILNFAGQRYAITKELNRHRWVIKWKG